MDVVSNLAEVESVRSLDEYSARQDIRSLLKFYYVLVQEVDGHERIKSMDAVSNLAEVESVQPLDNVQKIEHIEDVVSQVKRERKIPAERETKSVAYYKGERGTDRKREREIESVHPQVNVEKIEHIQEDEREKEIQSKKIELQSVKIEIQND